MQSTEQPTSQTMYLYKLTRNELCPSCEYAELPLTCMLGVQLTESHRTGI